MLDAELHPCPAWVGNELYIGGIGLAHGYVGDAAKTAASFIVHPRTRERLYRTGDLGRWQADGEVACPVPPAPTASTLAIDRRAGQVQAP